MFLPLFIAFLVQGLLLGLVVLALLAAAPKLQKRYGPRWLCRLWVALAVLFLVPVRALLPQAPAAVTVSAQPFYTQMTALTEETTTKPAANVPYRTTTADDNTMHYIVPPRGTANWPAHRAGTPCHRYKLGQPGGPRVGAWPYLRGAVPVRRLCRLAYSRGPQRAAGG